jgi:hypothetical protein
MQCAGWIFLEKKSTLHPAFCKDLKRKRCSFAGNVSTGGLLRLTGGCPVCKLGTAEREEIQLGTEPRIAQLGATFLD